MLIRQLYGSVHGLHGAIAARWDGEQVVRLFIAIELDRSIRRAIGDLQGKFGRSCEGVKWTPVEQLHLTVKFLGEVADGDVAGVSAGLSRAAARVGAFEIRVSGCGCFPPGGAVRIVWVGAGDYAADLLACVEQVEEEMEQLGFPREARDFSPHITIGRVKEDRSRGQIRAAVGAAAFPPHVQPVASLVLMSSVLTPKGPVYAPVGHGKLRTE